MYPISKLNWTNQKYPSVKAWKLVYSTTKKVFDIQDKSTLGPFSSFGEWLTSASQRNTTHRWYYFPSHQEITISDSTKMTSHFANKVDSIPRRISKNYMKVESPFY